MKIVVIGAGKLGRTIIKDIAKGKNDIIVIDTNEKVVDGIVSDFDVIGYTGNGSTIDTLKSAGCQNADLLIAVTPSDELNLFCCVVARKINIKKTIARVRNPEYKKDIEMLKEELGISLSVNPELDAANEIERILRFPSASKIEKIGQEKVNVIEIALEKDNPIVGKKLSEISFFKSCVLITAVSRNGTVYIPKGNFTFKAKDEIFMVGETYQLIKVLKTMGVYRQTIKNVLIVGGSKISYYLAKDISSHGMSVKVIEQNRARCLELADSLPKAEIICGDATDTNLLEEEGFEKVDAVVTVTGHDETNMIISSYCHNVNKTKVITKINNTNYRNIASGLGIDSTISPIAISSDSISKYVRGMSSHKGDDFKTLYRFLNNKLEAAEFVVSSKDKYTDIPLKSLKIKSNVLIACLVRNNKVIIPNGDDTIKVDDTIIIFSINESINDVGDILN